MIGFMRVKINGKEVITMKIKVKNKIPGKFGRTYQGEIPSRHSDLITRVLSKKIINSPYVRQAPSVALMFILFYFYTVLFLEM